MSTLSGWMTDHPSLAGYPLREWRAQDIRRRLKRLVTEVTETGVASVETERVLDFLDRVANTPIPPEMLQEVHLVLGRSREALRRIYADIEACQNELRRRGVPVYPHEQVPSNRGREKGTT